MKKTWFKDSFRNIKKRFVSWLSIVIIVLVGGSIINGLIFAVNSLEYKCKSFYNGLNFADLDLMCSFGLAEADISEIKEVNGVNDVEGSITLPGEIYVNGQNMGLLVMSMTDRISTPYAIEGTMPSAPDECAVCKDTAREMGIKIGDEVDIEISTARFSEILKNHKYKVTAIACHPSYAMANVQKYCIVTKDVLDTSDMAFDYTNLLVDVDTPRNDNVFGNKYFKIIEVVENDIWTKSDEITKEKIESINNMLDEEYDKAKNRVDTELAEGKKKLDAGYKEFDEKIAEAWKTIEDGERELNEGKEKAQAEFAAAEKKIKDGENEYNTKIADGERQIKEAEERAEKEINDAKWQIFDGYLKIEENKKLLGQKEEEYKEGQYRLQAAAKQLEKGRAEYQASLNEIDQSFSSDICYAAAESILALRDEEKGPEYNADLEEIAAGFRELAQEGPLERAHTFIEIYDALTSEAGLAVKEELDEAVDIDVLKSGINKLDEGKRKLEDGERQYADGEAELIEGRARLDEGWFSISQAEVKLAEGQNELAKKEPEARKKIQDAKDELASKKEEGKKQLEDAKKQFATEKSKALAEIAKHEKELEDGKKEFETQKKNGEEELAKAQSEYDKAEKEAYEKLAEAKQQIKDNRLSSGQWLIQTREANPSFMELSSYCSAIRNVSMVFTPLYGAIVAIVCFFTMSIIIEEQTKQIGTCKAFGMYNAEIRNKYVLFGATAAILGTAIGMGGARALELLMFNSLAQTTVFGMINHRIGIIAPVIFAVAALAITCIAIYGSCQRYIARPAIALISGTDTTNKMKKKAGSGKFKNIYLKLVLSNLTMDIGRETVSVVIVVICCILIGLGMTIKLAYSGALTRQINDIWIYDIRVTEADNISDEELEEIRNFVADYEYMQIASTVGLIKIDDEQVLTEIACIDDNASFAEFYNVMNNRGKHMEIPDDGVLMTLEMADKNKLTAGREATIITLDLLEGKINVKDNYLLYMGKMVLMTSDYYRTIFDSEPKINTYLIKTGNGNEQEIVDKLNSFRGVSDVQRGQDLIEDHISVIELYNSLVIITVSFSILLSFMILLNLSSILVNHRMRELLTMRINGFYGSQVIGYLAREVIITLVLAIVIALGVGIPAAGMILTKIESNGFMFIRTPFVFAWVFATLINTLFSLIINAMAFRNVTKVPLTDISKY